MLIPSLNMFKNIQKFLLFLTLLFSSFSAFGQSSGVGAIEYITTTLDGVLSIRSLIDGNKLFVVTQNNGLFVLDVSDFQNPKEIAKNTETGFLNGGLQKKDSLIYVSDGLNGILVFQFNGKDALTKKYEYKTNSEVWDLYINGSTLYSAESTKGLVTYKINTDGSLTPNSSYPSIKWSWAWRIKAYGDSLYVADKDAGIKVFNIKNQESPEYLTSFTTNGTPKDVYVENGLIYVANGPSGLSVYSLENRNAREIEKVNLTKSGDIQAIIHSGNYFFVTGGNSGVYILLKKGGNKIRTEFVTSQSGEDIGITKRNIEVYVAGANGVKIYKYNTPPILNPIAKQLIDENSNLIFKRTGYDPDSSSVVISAENLPEGAEYDIEKAIFSWIPNFDQSGTYQVYFTITENTDQALFMIDTVNIVVRHVNRKPNIAVMDDQTIDEAQLLTFAFPTGTDPDKEDQGKLNQFVVNLPEGATFNNQTFDFSWKPTYKQSGEYKVKYGVVDPDGLADTQIVVIRVNNVNLPPVIADISNQTIDENKNLAFKFVWSDEDIEDQGKLIVEMIGLPDGAKFDKATGDFSWTPTYEQSGSYDVELKVTDSNSDGRGAKVAEKVVNIKVNHVSRVPIIADLKDITIKEDEQLVTTIRYYDLDKEDFGKLTLTAKDLPIGATLVDSTLSWHPDYFQAGDYTITFTVTEPSGLNSTKTLKIKVLNVNRVPIIAEFTNPFDGNENELLTIKYNITDPDLEPLKITIDKIPAGASFDAETQTLTWTPSYEQAGKYDYTITAVDPLLGKTTALQSILIKNVNRPPVFSDLSDQSVKEVEILTFKLTAADPDKQIVSVSHSELPVGAKYDIKTGVFSWKPTYDQSGSYPITFTATDPENATATKNVTITVINVNRAPTLEKIAAIKGKENEEISLQLTAKDPDNDKLVYSTTDAPRGVNVNSETGVVTWTPGYDQSGKYTVTFVVTDPEGAKSEAKGNFDIANVNAPPTIKSISDVTVTEGETINFTVEASDPDGETLTFSISGSLPSGAKFDSNSGNFSWSVPEGISGEFGPFTVKVTDKAKASASADFKITVKAKPQPNQ